MDKLRHTELSYKKRYVPYYYLESKDKIHIVKDIYIYPPRQHPGVFVEPTLYRVDIHTTDNKLFRYGFQYAYTVHPSYKEPVRTVIVTHLTKNDIKDGWRIIINGYPESYEYLKTWEVYK